MKKYIRVIVSFSVTSIFIWLLFRNISFERFLSLISKTNFGLILLTLFLFLITSFIFSPLRWKLILNKIGCSLSCWESIFIKIGSDPVINIIPLRAGEVFKVLYLRQKRNISSEKVFVSIFIEYLFNVMALLFFSFFGIVFYAFQSRSFLGLQRNSLFMSFLSGKVNLLKVKWIDRWKKYLKPDTLKNIKIFFDRKILFYTFFSYFVEIFAVYLIAKALGIDIPFIVMLAYLPLVILISSIPIAIYGVGLREGLILFLFIKYSTPEKLLALGFSYSFLSSLLPAFLGLSLTFFFMNRIIFHKKGLG